MKTKEQILERLKTLGEVTGKELSDILEITPRAVRKQLAQLLDAGVLVKRGRPPQVFYSLNKEVGAEPSAHGGGVGSVTTEVINKNFLFITPDGKKKEGMTAFAEWCGTRNLSVEKAAVEYVEILNNCEKYKKDGLIDGMYKMRHTFAEVFLDKVFYLDFYSIERFGKTKLGQLLLYAKQSQNKKIIKELVDDVRGRVVDLVTKYKVDAVGYIPPTVKREVQFMKELNRRLGLSLPEISIHKIKTEVVVPQKTLSKLDDRVMNAKSTMVVDDRRRFKTILLIDDALGSGATLNEVARKIKSQGVAETVIGLAITGSFSGFEVISEV